MNKHSTKEEVQAIIISVIFLVLGFFAVWLLNSKLHITGDAVFVSVLLIPIIVYLIFSGRLTEIRAPGGLEAKFVGTAEKSVEPTVESVEASTEEMQVVAKEGLRELQRIMPHVDESKPITLTVTLGKSGYYQREPLLQYVKVLSQYRNFKFVLFLNQENRFVAYMPSWMVKQTLEMDALGNEFVHAINEGRVNDIRRYGAVTQTLSTKATNIQAIQEMTTRNLEALVVIDEEGRLKGVVEREQLLSKFILAMAT